MSLSLNHYRETRAYLLHDGGRGICLQRQQRLSLSVSVRCETFGGILVIRLPET